MFFLRVHFECLTFCVFLNAVVRVLIVTIAHFHTPAGWDNDKNISILYENMQSIHPDAYYTDVISRPAIKKVRSNYLRGQISAAIAWVRQEFRVYRLHTHEYKNSDLCIVICTWGSRLFLWTLFTLDNSSMRINAQV